MSRLSVRAISRSAPRTAATRRARRAARARRGPSKPQLRADDEVLDRARDEHLAAARERVDARADVDGDAAHVAVEQLALAGVQPAAHDEAEIVDAVDDLLRAAHGARGPVEGHDEAVAERS